jgi:hypothetical protein
VTDALRRDLENTPVPDAHAAQQRAWSTVRAAAPPAADAQQHPSKRRGVIVAVAALATVGTVAAAAASGAPVADWVKRHIDPTPRTTQPPTVVPAPRLPTPGRLLVRAPNGGLVLINADGTRRRLGLYTGASWSPRGLYTVAWRANQLSAIAPDGSVRWQHTTPGRVRAARWSPDGYRIAYLTEANQLRVIAGDGTKDHSLAEAGQATPAWRPDKPHTIAFLTRRGRIRIQDVDTGARTPIPARPAAATRTIAWSTGGRLLTTTSPHQLQTHNLRTGEHTRIRRRTPARYVDATYAPGHPTLARITTTGKQSTVTAANQHFTTQGRIASATWSPDGRWLLLNATDADQLIAIRVVGKPRVQSYPGANVQDWSG